jgi:HD superfamily phosphohydrolase
MILLRKLSVLLLILFTTSANAATEITTIWGKEQMDDPMLEEIVNHKIMQRLKTVDQSGPVTYFNLAPHFSRYEHSTGVWALVKKAGGSRKEQAAALLHDASHTAFSHVADVLFDKQEGRVKYFSEDENSYQDKIHLWLLSQYKIDELLSDYSISLEDLSPDNEEYKALEKPRPHLCADRIQYNIHTAVEVGLITKKQAKEIVDNLEFNEGEWYFTDVDQAKTFAKIPLFFTRHFWKSPWNDALYHYFSAALKRAINREIITEEDVQFLDDREVLDKLYNSQDKVIEEALSKCGRIYNTYYVVDYGEGDLNIKPKLRAVDPLVKYNGGFKQLTNIDENFRREYKDKQNWAEKGYGMILEPISAQAEQ